MWAQGDQIWSRIYEAGSRSWTRPLLVTTATNDAHFYVPQITAGNMATTLYWGSTAYGAYYQRGIGWIQSSIVDIGSVGVADPYVEFGVAATIDRRGNALAIGKTGTKRYIPGQGWQATVEHGLDLGVYRLWTTSAIDGTVLLVTHEPTTGYELIPRVVRFE